MGSTRWQRFLRERQVGKAEIPVDLNAVEFASSNRVILYLHIGIVTFLCALVGGLGGGAYNMLYNAQERTFRESFESLTDHVAMTLDLSISNMVTTSSLVNDLYGTAILNGYVDPFPNATLPGFESIMTDIATLASMRSLQFAPLVKASQRKQWEAYAASHVSLLGGPASLTQSTDGSWTVKDGIFNFAADHQTKVKASNAVKTTTHPDWLFPLWQAAPIASNAAVVMLECHAENIPAADAVIKTLRPAVTDAFQLYQDGDNHRPSTIMYSAITSPYPANKNELIGFATFVFTWDDLFRHAVPSYFGRVYCVMTTGSQQYTFALDGTSVTVLGTGDLHDSSLDKYGIKLSLPSLSELTAPGYTFTLYPSRALFKQYLTTTPRDACIVVVLVIVFTALLVVLHNYYVGKREKLLIDGVKHAEVTAASTAATLESKKVFVRFISHEIRTPMNAASLGIQLLEKSLRRAPESREKEANLETLSDMRSAFDMALAILNDMLNFDKMESGNFTIEPADADALLYMSGCLKLSILQAREKDIQLRLDVSAKNVNQGKPVNTALNATTSTTTAMSSILSRGDIIYIDKYKMDQVIRNLISNAIKFTPAGKCVTVRVRKVPEILEKFHRESREINEADLEAGLRKVQEKEGTHGFSGIQFADGAVHTSARSPVGTLIVDVIDEGVGIAPENIKKLFKEVVQFNPGKLQAGGGSGLGMMISKGIVDMHGGELSVSSEGEGKGTTFTLKLPLYERGLLSRSPSANASGNVSGNASGNASASMTPAGSESVSMVPSASSSRKLTPRGIALVDLQKEVNDKLDSLSQRGSFSQTAPDTVPEAPTTTDHPPLPPPRPAGDIACVDLPHSGSDTASSTDVGTATSKESTHQPLPELMPPAGVMKLIPSEIMAVPSESLKVLVVDDSKLNRRMLVRVLESEGHHCEEAEDGMQAVEKAGANAYDAILMDFVMPVMDGPTATREIREMGYKGVILGVTGNALSKDIDAFMEHGVNQVLIKPVDGDCLRAAFAKYGLIDNCATSDSPK